MFHEVPDPGSFLREIKALLNPALGTPLTAGNHKISKN